MQVLAIYLVDNVGNKTHFGATNSIHNANWVKVSLETLKERGWLHPSVKEIKVEIENYIER